MKSDRASGCRPGRSAADGRPRNGLAWGLLFLAACQVAAQRGDQPGESQAARPAGLVPPPAPALSPREALASFEVASPFRIQLVASEPMVQDPVAIAFDARARLWVVEMRGFMPDVDGKGAHEPVGRVSVLEDIDRNGTMDKSTVFLDGLILPRAIAVVRQGILVADWKALMFARDLDGDDRADVTQMIDPTYSQGGNVEHKPNGLLRGLDNWYYNAKSSFRYRLKGAVWMKERTEFRGQWGISKGRFGHLFYNYNWDQLRGDLVPPGYLLRNPRHLGRHGFNFAISTNQTVHPIRMNTGVNRGYRPGILDARGRIREFASACSPLIYRGDQFDAGFQGNAFVCGPGGNLVKRNILWEQGLEIHARNAYRDTEFLASRDERFRPVFLANAPDGTLYVVDMYRGILQDNQYMTSYLRGEILSRGLDRPIHKGRIYRVVQEGNPIPRPEDLEALSNWQLVDHLSYSNGWTRDTAQRLLIERHAIEQQPRLEDLALDRGRPIAQVHALWTLEGLGAMPSPRLFGLFHDPSPKVVAHVIRVFELWTARNWRLETPFFERLGRLLSLEDPGVHLQIALTAGSLSVAHCLNLLEGIATQGCEDPTLRDAILSSLFGLEARFLERIWQQPSWRQDAMGRSLLIEALATAILNGGKTGEVEELLGLLQDVPVKFTWRHRAVLAAAKVFAGANEDRYLRLNGPPKALEELGRIPDPEIRSEVQSLGAFLTWPGHVPRPIRSPAIRPLTENGQKLFLLGRQQYLIVCSPCHGPAGGGLEPLGPPLRRSEWVLGSPGKITRIVLGGLEGPIHIGKKRYGPPQVLPNMPSVASLSNEEIAAVLTYVRRAWGHAAGGVSSGYVAQLRNLTFGRQAPWTEAELREVD